MFFVSVVAAVSVSILWFSSVICVWISWIDCWLGWVESACATLALVPSLAPASAKTTAIRASSGTGPHEGSCPIFPKSNSINQDISHAPVDPNSAAYIASIGLTGHLHPDFGTNPSYGIPYTVVGPHQPKVPIKFTEYGEESNPGPYPIPANAPAATVLAARTRFRRGVAR